MNVEPAGMHWNRLEESFPAVHDTCSHFCTHVLTYVYTRMDGQVFVRVDAILELLGDDSDKFAEDMVSCVRACMRVCVAAALATGRCTGRCTGRRTDCRTDCCTDCCTDCRTDCLTDCRTALGDALAAALAAALATGCCYTLAAAIHWPLCCTGRCTHWR